jgi:hypothetical protein
MFFVAAGCHHIETARGYGTSELLEQTLRPGGCLEVVRRWRAGGMALACGVRGGRIEGSGNNERSCPVEARR